jgi:Bacterial antitoxin of type II TA system, VapB
MALKSAFWDAFGTVPVEGDTLWRFPSGRKSNDSENHHFRPPSYTLTYTFNCVSVVIEKRMPTNLAIDDRLIEEAQKLGQHRTKKEAVTAALDEYIRRHKQQEIIGAFGTIDYDEDYDYKRERRAKRG